MRGFRRALFTGPFSDDARQVGPCSSLQPIRSHFLVPLQRHSNWSRPLIACSKQSSTSHLSTSRCLQLVPIAATLLCIQKPYQSINQRISSPEESSVMTVPLAMALATGNLFVLSPDPAVFPLALFSTAVSGTTIAAEIMIVNSHSVCRTCLAMRRSMSSMISTQYLGAAGVYWTRQAGRR